MDSNDKKALTHGMKTWHFYHFNHTDNPLKIPYFITINYPLKISLQTPLYHY